MKHFFLFALVLAIATTTFGAPLNCGTLGSPTACSLGDKVFTNFVSTGFPSAAVSVTELIPNRQYVLNIDGLFSADFNFSYTVAVNGSCPSCKITTVAGSMSGQGIPVDSTLTTTVNGVTGVPTTGAFVMIPVTPAATSVDVSNAFAANGSSVTRISNTIVQGTPEPLSLGLTGLGLAVFGFVARRKFAR
jgi:hypothetical protein